MRRQFAGQRSPRRTRSRDHDLRSLVQPVPGVVKGVDRRPGLEMQIGPPIDPLQQVAEERGDIMDIECGLVFAGDDQEVFRQRKLALAKDGVGDGQDLLGPCTLASGT